MADHATAARAVGAIGDRMPLVFGLLLTSLTLRPQVVGVGPLVPEIQQALGMSHAFTGLLVTIPVLCLGIFAPLAPIIARNTLVSSSSCASSDTLTCIR